MPTNMNHLIEVLIVATENGKITWYGRPAFALPQGNTDYEAFFQYTSVHICPGETTFRARVRETASQTIIGFTDTERIRDLHNAIRKNPTKKMIDYYQRLIDDTIEEVEQ
jgi:hypothetical protein